MHSDCLSLLCLCTLNCEPVHYGVLHVGHMAFQIDRKNEHIAVVPACRFDMHIKTT